MESMTYATDPVNAEAPADLDPIAPYTAADEAWWNAETRDEDLDGWRWTIGPEPDWEPEPSDFDEPDGWFDALYVDRLDDGWPTDADCLPGRIG